MDWKKMIEELEGRGLTQGEIAERCGMSQPYVSQLKHGKRLQVSHPVGEALKALHRTTARRASA